MLYSKITPLRDVSPIRLEGHRNEIRDIFVLPMKAGCLMGFVI